MKTTTTIAILLFLTSFQIVLGQVPRSITIQGVLTSDHNATNRQTIIKTSLHESVGASEHLFVQIDTIEVQRDGLFTIILGKDDRIPSYLLFDKQYFVQFTVNGNQIPLRIPLQTVPYALTSEKVANSSVNVEHLSDELKLLLNINNRDNSNKSEKSLANWVAGLKAVIAGGDENRTSAHYSSILGGFTNNVSGAYGVVSGGQSNFVSGNLSFIGGGQNNRAFGSWSNSIGGLDNTVTSSSSFGTIAGGQSNQAGSNHATIGGGQSNISGGLGSTVGGGVSNRAMQAYATVSGGQNNFSAGMHSTISGGSGNNATNSGSVVAGGMNNKSHGQNASIAGGTDNSISNNAPNSYISGGSKNTINSGSNSGTSGANNTISFSNNAFAVGASNTINSANNGITIGNGNQVNAMNAIALGTGNIVNNQNELVLGSFASTSSNPANTSNVSFIGNKRFTIGNGTSGTRKNALTIFETGNTIVHGKLLVTDSTFLNHSRITSLTIDSSISALNLSGTNSGDVTIGTANGLSLSGQTLSLSAATITSSGAMSSTDKIKLDGISNGAEVNVNADWNAITGDAEILNKPTLGTMSAETANDYYTKMQVDAGFHIKDTDLTTVATIGTSDQLLKVKNDGNGLEWFTPTYISSYTETDPQIGTIITNTIPVWDGATLVTGSLTDNGTNVSTSATFTSLNITGTNTGDITLDKTNGLSLSSQVLSLDTATTTTNGAMSKTDKAKLSAMLQGDVSLPDVQEFSSSGTWVKPAGAKYVEIYCIGGGGGGGGGAFKLFHSIRNGGEGGGGATVSSARLTSASLPSTVDITIGAGGAGGGASLADGSGNDGATGGESSFGIYVLAAGGNHGDGGSTNSSTYSSNNSFPSGMGILNCVAWKQTSANTAFFGNYSGAGGRYNTANSIVPATTFFQPSGGGAGGYNNVNSQEDVLGLDGGILRTTYGSITQATGNSVSGTTVTWGDLKFGGGGTGGKSRNSAGDGYNGGDGAYPGGGGGGGGAANRSVSNKSGAGGGGGGGAVFVITYF